MLDLLVLCEGHTERAFCREVVAPHAATRGVALAGTLVGKPQHKQGGIRPWAIYRSELLRLAKERPDRHLSVLVDYYAMPASWPGRAQSGGRAPGERGAHVETALIDDLADVLPARFHPCVQLHEFESLLFVDPGITALSLAVGGGVPNHEFVAAEMARVRESCGGAVEQINDSPETAPSKRLLKLIRGYDKVAWGVTAAADVPLDILRNGCPWLDRWLGRIEAIGTATLAES